MATMIDLQGAFRGKQPCPKGEIWLSDSDVIIVPKGRILETDDFINLLFTRGLYGVFPVQPNITFAKTDDDLNGSYISSHISFSCRKIGSALRRMNSSTSIPSMVGGRRTRFCLPFIKTVVNSRRRRLFSAFSAGVSLRLSFFILSHPFRGGKHPRRCKKSLRGKWKAVTTMSGLAERTVGLKL